MSTDVPPAKRQRTDDDGPEGKEITRSKYWFDDGNVILQAENTQFRVHRSMLAHHSNVFKDMFSMPQPEQSLDPYIDGCPVVTLSDKAEDVEYIISLLYDNFRMHDMRVRMPFEHLAAVLHLGKKYEIDHLRDEGLRRLRKEFPSTLELWDQSYDRAMEIDDVSNRCVDIINLAQELSVQTVLPVVYLFYIATATVEEIIRDGRDDDASVSKTDKDTLPGFLNRKAIVEGCLIGRDKLMRRTHEILKQWLEGTNIIPGLSCTSNQACKSQRVKVFLALPAMALSYTTVLRPLKNSFTSLICSDCKTSVISAYDEAREEIWESLPTMFGLPKWKDLKDFDA